MVEVTWYLVITTGKAKDVDGGDEGQRGAASGGTVLPSSVSLLVFQSFQEGHSAVRKAGVKQAS